MAKANPLPPRDLLLARLDYDPETGDLRWKVRAGRISAGQPAGRWMRKKCGLRRNVCIENRRYYSARLIWLMVTGVDPGELEVDHQDGNSKNERFSNLRLATRAEQSRNSRKPAKGNTTLPKGVYFHKECGAYAAQIYVDDQARYLGRFKTPEEAGAAYEAAARKHFGEFACYGEEATERLLRAL